MKVTLVTQLTSMHEVMNFWRVWSTTSWCPRVVGVSTTSWVNPPMQLWRSLMVQQSLQVHHHFVNALPHVSSTAPTSLQWSLPVPLKELYIRYNINTSIDVTPQYKQRLQRCIGLTPIDMVSLLESQWVVHQYEASISSYTSPFPSITKCPSSTWKLKLSD